MSHSSTLAVHDRVRSILVSLALLATAGCGQDVVVLQAHPDIGSRGAPFPFATTDPMFELGQSLFFDKELSGNRNISCATCHVPFLQTVEYIPLSIGQGGVGVGPTRALVDGEVLPRNTSDLFNRNHGLSASLLWDGRVELMGNGTIRSPKPIMPGMDELLEVQAVLPMLDRDEMRGHPGDIAEDGRVNELAMIGDDQPLGVYAAIRGRIIALPGYQDMIGRAFPFQSVTDFDIAEATQAIAVFITTLWSIEDTTFDDNENFGGGIDGDPTATFLDPQQALGQELFFGRAGCANCHGSLLLSDQEFHNIGVPQFGPGKEGGLDEGRFLVTRMASDRFAFRTPQLRNVRLTPPYMHNGAYATLEDAIRHHLDPEAALRAYDGGSLSPFLRAQLHNGEETIAAILETLDPALETIPALSNDEIAALVAFLGALDSRTELLKGSRDGVPETVPSGLTIDRWPGGAHPAR